MISPFTRGVGRRAEGRCKSMYYNDYSSQRACVRSPSGALCTTHADIVFSHVTCENIPVTGLSCALRSLLPLAPRSYAHQFAFPFAYSVTLSSRASASSAGPVIIEPIERNRISRLQKRFDHKRLFYRFAKRVVTFWSSVRAPCVMHIARVRV